MDLSTFSYSHIYWIFLLPLIGAGADIITGWIQTSINNCWKSDIMRAGLYRKSGELLIVVLGFVAEQAVPVIGQYKLATWILITINKTITKHTTTTTFRPSKNRLPKTQKSSEFINSLKKPRKKHYAQSFG